MDTTQTLTEIANSTAYGTVEIPAGFYQFSRKAGKTIKTATKIMDAAQAHTSKSLQIIESNGLFVVIAAI